MAEIRVPTLGESVTEATIGKWFKKPGEAVAVDEPLVELETDKVTIEVPAPAAGVLAEIAAKDGETVAVGALLGADQGRRRRGAAGRPDSDRAAEAPTPPTSRAEQRRRREPAAARRRSRRRQGRRRRHAAARRRCASSPPRAASIPPSVAGTGKDGRVTKGDMLAAIERAAAQPTPVAAAGRRRAGARALAAPTMPRARSA